MPQIIRHGPGKWANYHETVKGNVEDRLELSADPNDHSDAASFFRQTAALIKDLLVEAVAKAHDLRPLGGAWSFSELNRTDGYLLETMAAGHVFSVKPQQVAAGSGLNPGTLVLAAGGTRIGALNQWLDPHGLSLKTSGASDGQSLAGAMATGTHGSVPGTGGIQNHLRGIHLVVSPAKSLWIERSGTGALDPGFISGFADHLIKDDALFEAAAVHLGGLGFVNAVLLEVVPTFLLEVVQQKRVIAADWLTDLERGDFRAIAARFGHDEEPYFYQLILDPFGPLTKKGLHRLYFKRPSPGPEDFAEADFFDFGDLFDPMMLMAEIFATFPMIRGPAIGVLMETMYKTIPAHPDRPLLQTWPQTTPPHKKQGKLFSTGFAVPRERLRAALDAMFGAFHAAGGGDVVTTLRFVGKSAGTMAFTRFENSVVIDFDGFRSDASRKVTQAAIAALNAAGIPFSRHWGKMAPITAGNVEHDYGAKAKAWRTARAALLPPEMQDIFASTALRTWGLA